MRNPAIPRMTPRFHRGHSAHWEKKREYATLARPDGSHTVRKDDGFFSSTGTKIGETDSMKDSLDVIKSDSGAKDTKIKDI